MSTIERLAHIRAVAEQREAARLNGNYKIDIVINAEPETALDLANRYADLCEQHSFSRGLKKALIGRKLVEVEKQLCEIGHLVPSGNTELYALEVESGLLEPYDPDDKYDRAHVAKVVAAEIITSQPASSQLQ